MSLGSQEVAPASVRKRDPPPTPLHLHRVCFCPQDRNYRNYSATRTSNWKFPTADDIREDLVHIGWQLSIQNAQLFPNEIYSQKPTCLLQAQ